MLAPLHETPAIERLTAGRTSITIAHRLATAEAADQVIVFDQGRVVGQGTHEELLRDSPVYRRLHADWTAGTTVRGGSAVGVSGDR